MEDVPQTSGCNRKRSVAGSGQTSTSNVHDVMFKCDVDKHVF